LIGKLAKTIEGMVRFCCQIHQWEIYELAIQKDHIHLYLGAQPKWSPSDVMKRIKGGTSNKVRELFPTLDEIYWGSTFWADGFMVKSVGEMTDKAISHYIEEQRKS
jgi:putative transposase